MEDISEKLNVLIVDDEERIVRAIHRLLKPHYNVFHALGGADALDIIRSHSIHVIVSDQRMPEMTGSELLGKVKIISPSTIRILLTGYSDLTAVIDSVNQGEISRYITKPWNNAELLETITQAAHISRKLSENKPHTNVDNNVAQEDKKENLLILDSDEVLGANVKQLLGPRFRYLSAKTIKEASDMLCTESIGVLLFNMDISDKNALAFIKTIKIKQPNVLCLVIADTADITLLSSLINEGQIYRFLTNPIKQGQLKMYLSSALKYCKQLSVFPELISRHAVSSIKDEEEQKISSGLMKGWKGIQSIFKKIIPT